jgi:hypothetical protein
MDRGTPAILVAAAIALVVAVAAAVGAFGGSVETTVGEDEIPFEAIPRDGSAIVFSKSQGGGLEFLGVRIQRPEYWIDVALTVPEDCIDDDGVGNRTLRGDGACGELPISGPIDGGGITAEGDRIAILRLTLNKACFEAVATGSPWPNAEPACASS